MILFFDSGFVILPMNPLLFWQKNLQHKGAKKTQTVKKRS
jgi:hypothetical protein